jgi:hypothetical protein
MPDLLKKVRVLTPAGHWPHCFMFATRFDSWPADLGHNSKLLTVSTSELAVTVSESKDSMKTDVSANQLNHNDYCVYHLP